MRQVFSCILCMGIAACQDRSDSSMIEYTPQDDVSIEVFVRSSKWKSDRDRTFIYVDYLSRNNTGSDILIDIGAIQAAVGDTQSIGTYFDSIGSVEAGKETVPVGSRAFSLYFVFRGDVRGFDNGDLRIVRFGLVPVPDNIDER